MTFKFYKKKCHILTGILVIVSFSNKAFLQSISEKKTGFGKPNVLLIISDDEGFCEFGAYSDFALPFNMGAMKIQEWRKTTKTMDFEASIG